jgi:putative SOS response-associated peptidase YedK
MCGRYAASADRAKLATVYDVDTAVGPELRPSWNVAPTTQVYGVLERDRHGGDPDDPGNPERQIRPLRWGLVPSWAKDPAIGSRLINARVETLAEKPAWRQAFRRRRVVLPASGFYEWQPVEVDGRTRKQPYYVHPAEDGGLLSLAGLYELWPDPGKAEDDPDRWLWTATVVTTQATGPLGEIHDRAPLILPPDRIDAWLDPALTDPEKVARVLAGLQVTGLRSRPVSTQVNRVGHDGPELVDPLPEAPEQPIDLTLTAA